MESLVALTRGLYVLPSLSRKELPDGIGDVEAAARTNRDAKIYRPFKDDADARAWEASTFVVHEPGTVAFELRSAMEGTYLPTLHLLPGKPEAGGGGSAATVHQVMLHAEHQLLDGRGALFFYDMFWTVFTTPSLLDNPELRAFDGREVSRLPAAMADLLRSPSTVTQAQRATAADWMRPLDGITPIGVPVSPERRLKPPSTSKVAMRTLSPKTTTAVIEACRARRVTVTSAWEAAFALSLARAQPDAQGPDAGVAALSVADMRSHFPETFDPLDSLMRGYVVFAPMAVRAGAASRGEEGEALARKFGAALEQAQQRNRPGPGGAGAGVTRERTAALELEMEMVRQAVEAAGKAEGRRPGLPILSSYGVVDNKLKHRYGGEEGREHQGEIEVVNLWMGVLTFDLTTICFLYTWRGKMCMGVTYNSAYYTEADMQGLVDDVAHVMLEGLGRAGREKADTAML